MTDENITRSFIIDNYDLDKERRTKQVKQEIDIFDEVLSKAPRTIEVFFNDIAKRTEEFKNKFKDNKTTEVYISGYRYYEDIHLYLTTYLIVLETNNEVIERLMEEEKNKIELKRKKNKRYQQYLRLKEEFES